mmetsp:Transcript_22169/g.43612  ORF Transcript_22169/g.43612 Transcript_22169/m.43612 type:complete len:346 (+) Transcript_22169:1030-2067(+)
MAPPAQAEMLDKPPTHLNKQEKVEVLEAGPGGRTKVKKFGLEESKSGRSKCRSCHQKIEDETLRWTFSENNSGPFYFHLDCMPYPVDGVAFDDVVKSASLTNDQVEKAKEALLQARQKRAEAEQEAKEEEIEKLANMELTSRDGTRDSSEKDLREVYGGMPVEELKEYLRVNNYPLSGTKEELVNRCALGQTLGKLPRCPKCRWGKLTINTLLSTYLDPLVSCLGHFNTVYHEQCDYTVRGEEARALFEEKWAFLPDLAAKAPSPTPDTKKEDDIQEESPNKSRKLSEEATPHSAGDTKAKVAEDVKAEDSSKSASEEKATEEDAGEVARIAAELPSASVPPEQY